MQSLGLRLGLTLVVSLVPLPVVCLVFVGCLFCLLSVAVSLSSVALAVVLMVCCACVLVSFSGLSSLSPPLLLLQSFSVRLVFSWPPSCCLSRCCSMFVCASFCLSVLFAYRFLFLSRLFSAPLALCLRPRPILCLDP